MEIEISHILDPEDHAVPKWMHHGYRVRDEKRMKDGLL